MTLKKYLFLMIFATVLCFGAWALVLFFVNPNEAGTVGYVFFFFTLFCGLVGIFSILGFIFRYLLKRNEFAYNQVKTAFRQAVMLSFMLTAMLVLQGLGLLVWWNTILFVALLGVLEFISIGKSAPESTAENHK